MLDKVLLAFLIADGLFVLAGGLLLGVVFMAKNDWNNPSVDNVASTLLLMQTPVNGRSRETFNPRYNTNPPLAQLPLSMLVSSFSPS